MINSGPLHYRLLIIAAIFCSSWSLAGACEGQPPDEGFVVEPFLGMATPTSIHIAWETVDNLTTEVHYGTTPVLGQVTAGSTVTGAGAGFIHHVDLGELEPDTRYFFKGVSAPYESSVHTFRTPHAGPTGLPFSFVVYSDCQTGNNYLMHEEVVNDGVIDFYEEEYGGELEDHLSFVLIPGDLVSTGSNHTHWVDQFFGQAKNLFHRVPLYPALGNHEANAALYYLYFDLFHNAPEGLDEHCYWFDHQNIRVITLDTNGPYTTQAQLDWLDAVLDDACGNDEIDFVFAQFHHPHKSESWTPGESGFSTSIVERVEQFSTDCSKPSIHFFGHTHSYSRGQSRDHDHLMVNVASGSGSLDYWWDYPNNDYDEFQITLQEWGFVQMEVGTGDEPWFRLRRISRGNDYVTLDNEVTDEFVIRTNNTHPDTPVGLSPTLDDGPIDGDAAVLQGSAFNDLDGDAPLASHWQIGSDPTDFSSPHVDQWKRRENWYRPDNGDGWYSVNTVTDPDITRAAITSPIPGCTTMYWRVRYRDEVLGWSEWSSPTRFLVGLSSHGAHAPIPANLSERVPIQTTLQWNPCQKSESYDVYFSTDEALGEDALQTNQAETHWEPDTLDHRTTYYWRIDHRTGDQVQTGTTWSFTTMRALPTVSTTEWRFDDKSPTDGLPLHEAHGSSPMTPSGMSQGTDWSLEMTDGFVVPHINGRSARYIQMNTVYGTNRGLEVVLDAQGNGEGWLKDFTIVWDLYVEPSSTAGLQALWQGNDANSNEAEFFLDCATGGFWLNGGTGSVGADLWPHGQWFRLVHRVDFTLGTSAIFVDGVKVLGDDTLGAPDWLWCGDNNSTWFLTDNDSPHSATTIRCAALSIIDTLVPDTTIEALGTADARGIFVDRSEWRFDDAAPADGVPLAATHGRSVLIPEGMVIDTDWGLDTTDGVTVPHIDDAPSTFIWLDNVFGASRGLSTRYQATPNGGGSINDVYEYTIILDLFVDEDQSDLQALYQGNDTNTNDAEWFLDSSTGGFYARGTGYVGNDLWPQGEWFRTAIRVDYPDSAAIFINGEKVLDDSELAAPDWLWSGEDGRRIWLLSDNGPDFDVGLIGCANAAIVDGLVSDLEMEALGGPHGAGIFLDDPKWHPADLNHDGVINVGDLLLLLSYWGLPGGDIDGDGTTNIADLLLLLAAWG